KRNIIIGEIDKVSGILLPFLVRTMVIHLIGAEYLGLTGLFYSIVQMLNLTEMGFGTAIVYSMYRPIAENDTEAINALLAFYAKVYRIVGIIVSAVGLLLLPLLPHFISGQIPEDINLYALYLIYLANTCIGFFVYPERKALLIVHQRDDIGGRVHIVTQLGMYLAQAAFVFWTGNYYLYALMMPLSSLLYSLLCAKRAAKQYPMYCKSGRLDPVRYRGIKKQVAGLTIRKVAMLSRNAFDSLFVSAFLGLSATAVYDNYYYILDSVVMLLAVVKTSMAGGVGNSLALDSDEKNLQDMHRINFLYMWIGGWCSICLLCLYQPFMLLWVGESMTLPFGMVVLFALYFYVLKMSDIRTLYSESAGIWWEARYISVAEAAANLLLNWILVQTMGLYGIILATLISYFVFNFIGGAVILFRVRFTHGGLARFLLSHLKYAAVTVLAAFVTYAWTSCIPAVGIAGLLIRAIICVICPNLLYFLIYFRTGTFRECLPMVKNILKR
ncbi:MAG: oligosaccharide flippase family protein, partial [Clostridiales bacterium]|nr:oligosaccharide flippase family protein [Clostridiales bacterium]